MTMCSDLHVQLVTVGQTNWLYLEGGLLAQVQTHAMETLEPINLAVLYNRG